MHQPCSHSSPSTGRGILRVCIKITDTTDESVYEQSDAVFTIIQPSITVTSPNGGEDWGVATDQSIAWTANYSGSVNIEYSSDGGSSWLAVVSSISSQAGSVSWTVPDTPSNTCYVRITDASNSAVTDQGDSPFRISSPEINVSTQTVEIGDVDVGTIGTGTFVITNEGNAPLVVSSISSNNTVFTIDPSTSTLNESQQQTITVTFTPVEMGSQSATITIDSDDSDEVSLTVNVSGTGLAPEITLSETSVSIGDVDVGSSGTGTFVITNEGNKTLTVSSISSDNEVFTVDIPSASINAGQSQTVTVTFSPSERGEQSAIITVESDDSDEGSFTVQVTGTGHSPEISLSTTSLSLGDVNTGSSVNGMFTISNEGNSPLNVSSISSDNSSFTVNPSSATVNAGQSTTVTVTFSPDVMGEHGAAITIVSNSDEGSLTVQVNGTGRSSEMSVSSTSIAFGDIDVGSDSTLTFDIINNGNAHLLVTSISSDNPVYTITPSSVTVNAGQSTTITVTFSPQEKGEQSGIITIVNEGKTLTVQVNGIGRATEISLSNTSLAFGNVDAGRSATAAFDISNNGNAPL